jgi:hypothetical protein
MWKINLSKLIYTESSYYSHMARKLVEADADTTQSYSDKTIRQTVTLLTIESQDSQLIIRWPADNNIQHGAQDKQHALQPGSISHHRKTNTNNIARQTQVPKRDKQHALQPSSTQHHYTTRSKPRRGVPQWTARLASPVAEHHQRLERHRSFFILSLPSLSLCLSISVSLSIYLSISVYIAILSYLDQLSSFILSLQYH